MAFSQKFGGVGREACYSPEVSRRRGALRLRRELEDAIDQTRAAPRNLLELPPLFHRRAETDRNGRTRRAVHEEVRRSDVGKPQEGRESLERQEGNRRRPLIARSGLAPQPVKRRIDGGPPDRSFNLPIQSGEPAPNGLAPAVAPFPLQTLQRKRSRNRQVADPMLVMDRQRFSRLAHEV